MDALLKRLYQERDHLELHMEEGILDQYGADNYDDLHQLLTDVIRELSKGVQRDAA